MRKFAPVLLISAFFLFDAGPALAGSLTFTGASDLVAEATSAAGVSVSFTVTAVDASSTPSAVVCSPISGDPFALGTTTVTCEAADDTGATSTTSFEVSVVDTTPPAITPPADQTFATSTFPASPTLTQASAADLVDPNPVISVSTTTFNAGTTTVTWTATDASGNSSATTSQVVIVDNSAATSSATTTISVEGHVDVPATCEATDTDGVVHDYPEASSTNGYLGICALEAAKAAGVITDIGLSNQFPAFGLFVTEINGVAADPSSQYWALYQNGGFASVGITSLPVAAGDTIQFQLHDFSDNDLGSRVTLAVDSLIATTSTSTDSSSGSSGGSSGGGGGGGGGIVHAQLNVESALSFLGRGQGADGSFGSDLLTDWAAIAFAAADPGSAKVSLRSYLSHASRILSSVTDYERHAMALEALGINPYSGTPVDSIAPIVAAFDGTQVGDPSLDNDDIFAIFPLMHAGYGAGDAIIQKITLSIIGNQKSDGSWDESVDLTAAAIEALEEAPSPPGSSAIAKAEGYLRSKEQANGAFSADGTSFSTSWALQAIAALGETPSQWAPGGYYPTDYLAMLQQADGAVESASTANATRLWATEYAVPAALGKPWNSLLLSFDKPAAAAGGNGAAAATSSLPVATSTPEVASSTPTLATSSPTVASSTSAAAASTNAANVHPSTASGAAAPVLLPANRRAIVHALTPGGPGTTTSSVSRALPASSQTASAAAQTNVVLRFFSDFWTFITHLFAW